MTKFDFSKFEQRQEHIRYTATLTYENKNLVTCEIDVVGGVATKMTMTNHIEKEFTQDDSESVKEMAMALVKFTEMIIHIVLKGGPPDG